MNHITELEDQLASPVREMAQADLATRHRNGITQLLAQRDDLRGVYALADVLEESVRWSA